MFLPLVSFRQRPEVSADAKSGERAGEGFGEMASGLLSPTLSSTARRRGGFPKPIALR